MKKRTTWQRIERPRCDLCARPAVWQHAQGGRRCGSCYRPEPRGLCGNTKMGKEDPCVLERWHKDSHTNAAEDLVWI